MLIKLRRCDGAGGYPARIGFSRARDGYPAQGSCQIGSMPDLGENNGRIGDFWRRPATARTKPQPPTDCGT